jgi:hypothetical protein
MPRYRATFSGSPGLNQPSLWMHALLQSLQEQSSFSFIIIISSSFFYKAAARYINCLKVIAFEVYWSFFND